MLLDGYLCHCLCQHSLLHAQQEQQTYAYRYPHRSHAVSYGSSKCRYETSQQETAKRDHSSNVRAADPLCACLASYLNESVCKRLGRAPEHRARATRNPRPAMLTNCAQGSFKSLPGSHVLVESLSNYVLFMLYKVRLSTPLSSHLIWNQSIRCSSRQPDSVSRMGMNAYCTHQHRLRRALGSSNAAYGLQPHAMAQAAVAGMHPA